MATFEMKKTPKTMWVKGFNGFTKTKHAVKLAHCLKQD